MNQAITDTAIKDSKININCQLSQAFRLPKMYCTKFTSKIIIMHVTVVTYICLYTPKCDVSKRVVHLTPGAFTLWKLYVVLYDIIRLMPSSHLPRTPCDKFVYDFPCDFLGIVGGYGLRHMCSHCLRASCNFFYGASGATRGKSVQRLCRDCTEIKQC